MFTATMEQFGSHHGMEVQQGIRQVQHDAEEIVRYTDVRNIQRAYDKLDRGKLIIALEEWIERPTLDIVRTTMDTVHTRTERYPSGFVT